MTVSSTYSFPLICKMSFKNSSMAVAKTPMLSYLMGAMVATSAFLYFLWYKSTAYCSSLLYSWFLHLRMQNVFDSIAHSAFIVSTCFNREHGSFVYTVRSHCIIKSWYGTTILTVILTSETYFFPCCLSKIPLALVKIGVLYLYHDSTGTLRVIYFL